MKVIFPLACLALTSVLLFPQRAFAFSVERSAYDWVLADDARALEIPYVPEGDAGVVAKLLLMSFVDGDAENPSFSPLSEDILSQFALEIDNRRHVVRLTYDGAFLLLQGKTLALDITSAPDQHGGITARQGILIPLFLHLPEQESRFSLQLFSLKFFQWGMLHGSLLLRNEGESVVIPQGAIRATNLLTGKIVTTPINPGALRLPLGSSRSFAFDVTAPAGVWHVVVMTNEGERVRTAILVDPSLIFLGLSALAILGLGLARLYHGVSHRA